MEHGDRTSGSSVSSHPRTQELHDALRRRVSRQQYTTWFERTSVLRWHDNRLVLGVPNRFYLEWLRKHFMTPITQVASELDHAPVQVNLTVAEAKEPEAGPESDAAAMPPPPTHAPTTPPPPAEKKPTGYQPAPFVGSGPDDIPLQLNEHYTFENFIKGPSNSVAYAAAQAVAEKPGRAYNPLFIHGAVGLGKTHLLHAACRQFMKNFPSDRVCFLSCEEFINEFVSAIKRADHQAFRDRFRTVHLLVIDDIHFLQGKERTQEEFFHTFNQLYQSNRQIVVSSDAAPSEIPNLEDRLVSRFQWGLVSQLEQPEMETRMAIIHRKAELQGTRIPNDVVEYIASNFRNNIRELEGALVSVQACSQVKGTGIDLELAKEALEPAVHSGRHAVTIEKVVQLVCAHHQVKPADLRSKKRGRSVSEPRQTAMFLIRRATSHSLDEIGDFFGGRDHSTVLYAVRKMQDRVDREPRFAAAIERHLDRLGAGWSRPGETSGP